MTKKNITPEDAAAVLGSLGGRRSRNTIAPDAQAIMQAALLPYRCRCAVRKQLALVGPQTFGALARLPQAKRVGRGELRVVLKRMIEADEIERRGRKYVRKVEG